MVGNQGNKNLIECHEEVVRRVPVDFALVLVDDCDGHECVGCEDLEVRVLGIECKTACKDDESELTNRWF